MRLTLHNRSLRLRLMIIMGTASLPLVIAATLTADLWGTPPPARGPGNHRYVLYPGSGAGDPGRRADHRHGADIPGNSPGYSAGALLAAVSPGAPETRHPLLRSTTYSRRSWIISPLWSSSKIPMAAICMPIQASRRCSARIPRRSWGAGTRISGRRISPNISRKSTTWSWKPARPSIPPAKSAWTGKTAI